MRDLLNIIDGAITEATASDPKYAFGTPFKFSDSAPADIIDALSAQGINTDDEVIKVDPATVNPADITVSVGKEKTPWVFQDINEQYFVINKSIRGMFVLVRDLANRGEISEGILGAAMFAKFTKRKSPEDIGLVTDADIGNVLDSLEQTGEDMYQVTVHDSDNQHADTVTFKLSLKTGPYNDLMNQEKRKLLKNEYKSAVAYVNDKKAERYSKYFYLNGKADEIAVIAAGDVNERESKVDVWVAIKDDEGKMRRLRLNASLKAGPVKQFGQVGGGGIDSQIELWNHFNIDVSNQLEAFDELKRNDQYKAVDHMYRYVASVMNTRFKDASPSGEVSFINDLAHAVDYFATLGDPGVELVQFDKGGFEVLNFSNLRHKFKTLDLAATMGSNAKPELIIHDAADPKNYLIRIRCKIENKTDKKGNPYAYIRNIVEKGKLLSTLTKVERKSWEDEKSELNAKIAQVTKGRSTIKNPKAPVLKKEPSKEPRAKR